MTKRALLVLQNAWSKTYAGREWPRESWIRALGRSRSGQRLRVLTAAAKDWEFVPCNTTPEVAPTPNGILDANEEHLLEWLNSEEWDAVLGCGLRAAGILPRLWPVGRLILLPHPACRIVTNALLRKVAKLLNTEWHNRIRVVQKRGRAEVRDLDGRLIKACL